MRIALAFSLLFGAIFVASAAVSAAPLALSDHAAVSKTVGDAGAAVEQVGRRAKVRRYVRRGGCGWQCTPYWRPYQYRYWQFYYPYGGPLF
jgi:uncharacterized protein (UPF0333 family)